MFTRGLSKCALCRYSEQPLFPKNLIADTIIEKSRKLRVRQLPNGMSETLGGYRCKRDKLVKRGIMVCSMYEPRVHVSALNKWGRAGRIML